MDKYEWRWEIPEQEARGNWVNSWRKAVYDATFFCKNQEFKLIRRIKPKEEGV